MLSSVSKALSRAAQIAAFAGALAVPAVAEPFQLRIIGGLAGVSKFQELEVPFWTEEVPRLTGGRVASTIHPFDRSGLRGQNMLQLMKLGVVPFGTALLGLVSGEDPEINLLDLPGLNPDMETLRRNTAVFRPYLTRLLKERFNLELLGIYASPAQVVYCNTPFRGLNDLVGRRVRTSSVGQSEMVTALGGIPLLTPFSEIVGAFNRRVVDCAITGTFSGQQIGLAEVTSHVHSTAISWGLSVFAANAQTWASLPSDIQGALQQGIAHLEARIWQAAEHDTKIGLDCLTGVGTCRAGKAGRLTLIEGVSTDAALLRDVLWNTVVPRWVDRCGTDCVTGWNLSMSVSTGLMLSPEGRPTTTSEKRADADSPAATR